MFAAFGASGRWSSCGLTGLTSEDRSRPVAHSTGDPVPSSTRDPWPTPTSPLADARSAFDLPDDVDLPQLRVHGPDAPVSAVEAGWMGLARKGQPWTVAPDDFTVPVDQLRAALAGLLGVPDDVDGVAITPSVSYGVSTAAANLHLDPGQVAVVLDQQFPSDVYGWERLARRHGGALHTVARPADGDWTAALLADARRLGDRVGAVSVPPCHWIDGGRGRPGRGVSAATHRSGPPSPSTCARSLGAAAVRRRGDPPDFVVGATYKWLLRALLRRVPLGGARTGGPASRSSTAGPAGPTATAWPAWPTTPPSTSPVPVATTWARWRTSPWSPRRWPRPTWSRPWEPEAHRRPRGRRSRPSSPPGPRRSASGWRPPTSGPRT